MTLKIRRISLLLSLDTKINDTLLLSSLTIKDEDITISNTSPSIITTLTLSINLFTNR